MSVSLVLVLIITLLIVYANFLFPIALLALRSMTQKKELETHNGFQPTISILMAVFNEEKIIREKLKSVFETNYPIEKIEFLIGSDNSTDKTHAIIQEFIDQGYPVRLKIFKTRQGKPSIINQLFEEASGEIFILTDANVLFSENTIAELGKHFSNPQIGVVGANFVNYNIKKEGISKQEDTYIQLETRIKEAESICFGKMIGAFGGCFATRKSLYQKVPSNLVLDDFYISMKIIYQGYLSILAKNALVYEDLPNSLSQEFSRKKRMTVGNFQNLFLLRRKLFSPTFISFLFWSHKGLRWLTPLLSLMLVLLLLPFAPGHSWAFWTLISIGFIAVFIPLLERAMFTVNIHLKIMRSLSYFVLMNYAVLLGTFKFLMGKQNNIWKPTERLN